VSFEVRATTSFATSITKLEACKRSRRGAHPSPLFYSVLRMSAAV
jgi:hypothetical protein